MRSVLLHLFAFIYWDWQVGRLNVLKRVDKMDSSKASSVCAKDCVWGNPERDGEWKRVIWVFCYLLHLLCKVSHQFQAHVLVLIGVKQENQLITTRGICEKSMDFSYLVLCSELKSDN